MIALDTSYLVALLNERDAHHAAAAEARPTILDHTWGMPLLPDVVVFETLTVLGARRGMGFVHEVAEDLLEPDDMLLVATTPILDDAARIFLDQTKMGLSLFDAAVAATVLSRGGRHVASFDSGFSQVADIEVVP